MVDSRAWMEEGGKKVCRVCRLSPGPDRHDPCIANLPGVAFACCGHGVQEGYVCFTNGVVVRGWFEARGGPSVSCIFPMDAPSPLTIESLRALASEEDHVLTDDGWKIA